MRTPLACLITALLISWTGLTASAQEISIKVKPDDSVHITQGYDLEEIASNESSTDASLETSRITVRFPEHKPAVYEIDSEEDYVLIVDGYLPEGADILLEAVEDSTGEEVEGFRHVLQGGDWLIEARYLGNLPAGMVTMRATLRTPDRPDAVVSHPFFILEPEAIDAPQDAPAYEWELDEEESDNPAPFVPGDGFMSFEPPADAHVYYVSATGNDENDGLSPATPLRTLRRGYEKVRDDSGDWVLLKAGDVFDAGFGRWDKNGRSADQPLHIGVYGEGDRPVIHTNGDGLWRAYGTTKNIRMDGLYAYANARLGQPEQEITWRETGIFMLGQGENILLHDMKIEGFQFNVVFQGYSQGDIRNITLTRCILVNSFSHYDGAIGGHSSGIYTQAVSGLHFNECTFDRNGWNPLVDGAKRTIFNHNLYIQYNCSDITMRRSFVSRGASHGLQLRCGGDVYDSLFTRNALAFFVGRHHSVVMDNVAMESDDIATDIIRGEGILVLPVESAVVANNIVTRKRSVAPYMSALKIVWDPNGLDVHDGTALGNGEIQFYDNVVWDWRMQDESYTMHVPSQANVTRYNNAIDGVNVETGSPIVYRDSNVSMDRYTDGGLAEFTQEAVSRRRGEWDDKYSAPAFNAYMRQGFSPAAGGGDF